MPSRMFVGSRTVTGYRTWELPQKRKPEGLAVDRDGNPIPLMTPVPADSPQSPFREGRAYEDPDEPGVVYRIIRNMNPLEGWASTEWWQERLRTTHANLLKLVPRGLLDAAMHEGSRAKRYRCRDEHTAREFLRALTRKQQRARR